MALVSWFRLVAYAVLLVAAIGCAHDVRVHFPDAPLGAPTGTLVLHMGEPASGVTVAINGVAVVEDVHTGHIVIDGVPVGNNDIVIAANGVDKQIHTWVDGDHPTFVPLGVPDQSYGFVKTLAGTLLTILVYSLLHH